MEKPKDFCIFIISHGRPDKVMTWNTLKKVGNTSPVYIVIDDTDKTSEKYYTNFGKETVVMFDKEAIAKTTDHGDNFWNLRTTTHARNACFDIAKKLGYTYFLVLDDDYTYFAYTADDAFNYNSKGTPVKDINKTFCLFIDFYKSIPALSVCFAQGGDFVGGENSAVFKKELSRKAMNSWFCSVDRPFKFISRLNEDVNTYLCLGATGGLFFTVTWIRLEQIQTQLNSGGMTEAYLEGGTYVKSFYTVMYCPSFAKVGLMGNTNKRLHHRISWNNAVPKIVNENIRKI